MEGANCMNHAERGACVDSRPGENGSERVKGFFEQVSDACTQHEGHMVNSKDDTWLVGPNLQTRANFQDLRVSEHRLPSNKSAT